MKVCMNGFRGSLTRDVNSLKHMIETIIDKTFHEYYDNDELVDAMNQVISGSNILNCIHNKDDDDFADMSDVRIEFIKQQPTTGVSE